MWKMGKERRKVFERVIEQIPKQIKTRIYPDSLADTLLKLSVSFPLLDIERFGNPDNNTYLYDDETGRHTGVIPHGYSCIKICYVNEESLKSLFRQANSIVEAGE